MVTVDSQQNFQNLFDEYLINSYIMVCSICGIQGHNKRRCGQPIKEHSPSVVSNVGKMLVAVDG